MNEVSNISTAFKKKLGKLWYYAYNGNVQWY